MPLELDRQWVYSYTVETENVSTPPGDITHLIKEYQEVSSLDSINGFNAYKVNTWQEDSTWVDSEWYVQSDSGLLSIAFSHWDKSDELLRSRMRFSFHDYTFNSFEQLYRFILYSPNTDTTLYEPPRTLLKYPLTEESSWIWFIDPWFAIRTVEGNEIIEASLGLFDCKRIRIDYDIDLDEELDDDIVFHEWWSVNIGLIRRNISIYNIVEENEGGDTLRVYNAYINWDLIGKRILETKIEEGFLLESLVIHSIFPNPFNPSTTIEFSIPQSGIVTLNVYDVLGRQVETILNKQMQAGYHKLQWNASDVPSGIYFVRMQSGDFSQVRKVMVVQ